MTRRNALTLIIKAMFALLAFAFLFILLRSLGGPSHMTTPAALFDDVQYGQTALRRVSGQRVWATRLSPIMRNQLQRLDDAVVDENAGCALSSNICVLDAATSRSGIDVVFTEERPPQIDRDAVWYGGLVDPTNNAVYDRLGRRYKDTGNEAGSALPQIAVD